MRVYDQDFVTGDQGSMAVSADVGHGAKLIDVALAYVDIVALKPEIDIAGRSVERACHAEGRSDFVIDIPAPEPYAVHKLIVASRRRTDALGRAKRDKDLVQASLLSEALVKTRQSYLLADAYREAWARGEAWQETILSGLVLMPDNVKLALANALGVTVDRLGKA